MTRPSTESIFTLYLIGYALLSFYVSLHLSITWDEGAHTIGGVYFSDLFKDAAAQLPASLGPSWFADYSRAYFANHPFIIDSAFQYPLGHQWLSALVFLVLGPTVFAAKLLAIAFLVGTLFYVFRLGSLLFNRLAGVSAAVFLSMVPDFMVTGSRALIDLPVAFFLTAAFYHFFKGTQGREAFPLFGLRWDKHLLLSGLLVGLGLLTKNPVFLFYPVAYGYLFLAKGLGWLKEKRFLLPLLGLVVFGVYLGIFFAFVHSGAFTDAQRGLVSGRVTDQLFLRAGVYQSNDYPAVTTPDAWFIYPLSILSAFNVPLFLFALGGFWLIRRQYAARREPRLLFFLTMLLLLFFAFSLIRVKGLRHAYSFVALLALAAGVFLDWLLNRFLPPTLPPLQRAGAAALVVALVVFPAAFPQSFPFLPWPETPTPATHMAQEREFLALDAVARALATQLPADSEFALANPINHLGSPTFSFYLLQHDRGHSMKVTQYQPEEFLERLEKKDRPLYVLVFANDRYDTRSQVRDYVLSRPHLFPLYRAFDEEGILLRVYAFQPSQGGR